MRLVVTPNRKSSRNMLRSLIQPTQFEFDTVTVDDRGQVCDRQHRWVTGWREALTDALDLEMVSIPAGTFLMGTAPTEEGSTAAQSPQHTVSVASFSMGRFPITQAQWEAVATLPKVNHYLDPRPSNRYQAECPVEQVSWQDAVEFCARLTVFTGRPYRLPSEAEWEYACRAGTSTPFHFGATITTDLANYSGVDWEYQGKICSHGSYGSGPKGTDRRETTVVGHFAVANAFGLFDMHGNVREWCLDGWHPNYENAPADGSAWIAGADMARRVVRGGSWNGGPRTCRSAFRAYANPDRGLYDIGLRVLMVVEESG